jgi:hypothetical protein
MEIKLTISEIPAVLQGCQYTLRLISSSQDYRNIESSEYFSTLNDVVLNDAFNMKGRSLGCNRWYQADDSKRRILIWSKKLKMQLVWAVLNW